MNVQAGRDFAMLGRLLARWRFGSAAFGLISLVVATVALAGCSPAPPSATIVYYVATTNLTTWYNDGYNQGVADNASPGPPRLVVMDFGEPDLNSSGVYGAYLFNGIGFVDRPTMAEMATFYAAGYYTGVGSASASIELAVGESNDGSQVASNGYQQGRAWSNFVNTVASDTASYASHVGVEAAYDAELDYNGPTATFNQLLGFGSINSNMYVDIGDAAGCPSSGASGTASCDNGWTVDDVYTKAWDIAYAYPMPEIYTTTGSMAAEWANVTEYGATAGARGAMFFLGSLSQSAACGQVGGCSGTDNTPNQSWTQLYNAINANTNTAMTPAISDNIEFQY